MRLLLIDLSSLFRPIWEMSGKEADQDYASKATVARVHDMAQGYDGVAVCCDSRKSWRKELAPTYKANRPASEEPMLHQLRLAQEALAADGFPVWQSEGFEADDVIASAVDHLRKNVPLESGESGIVIASSDKDLFQLVGLGVQVKSIRSGELYGAVGVKVKFGVMPEQMRDWLCLVGDSSDNVKGVPGIGPKRATELLQKHGSLFELYSKLGDSCTVLGLTPSMFSALKDNVENVELARKLITLRTDVELPFADIFKPREVKVRPKASWDQEEGSMHTIDGEIVDEEQKPEPEQAPVEKSNVTDIKRDRETTALATVDWSKGLEPVGLKQAMTLATAIHVSKRYPGYTCPEDVLMAIMTGREFGMTTQAALRSIHLVEGKPTLSAALMAGLVLRSGTCEQFEFIERTKERAVLRIKRTGWKTHQDVTYSVEDAKQAGKFKVTPTSTDGKDRRNMWEKDPAAMCVARCQAIGARLGWPDVLANVYDPDEVAA